MTSSGPNMISQLRSSRYKQGVCLDALWADRCNSFPLMMNYSVFSVGSRSAPYLQLMLNYVTRFKVVVIITATRPIRIVFACGSKS